MTSSSENSIRLPRFSFKWTPGFVGGTDRNDAGFSIDIQNLKAPVIRRTSADRTAVAVGAPVIGERIDLSGTVEGLLAGENIRETAQDLNGQFLLIVADPDRLQIANDRFTSFPIYWAKLKSGLVGSLLYDDLIDAISSEPGFSWRSEPMVEFIWLQKLLHTKTYDSLSQFLPAASVLEAKAGSVDVKRYWQPSYQKHDIGSEHEAAVRFDTLLTNSLKRLTSDSEDKRYGHFLSGGHDSRTVLAAMPILPHCFTCSFSDNYEVSCARRAADAVQASFSFIKLPKTLFTDYQEEMSRLCGGMYATDHALFLGFEDQVQAHADVVFHGHGFDYMYQGMYLPARTVHWFGRPTFFRKLMPFDGNLISRFKDGISYGMLDPEARALIADDKRAHIESFIQASVEEVLHDGDAFCQSDADRWEHLINHALARHYSHPNIMSKSTLAEQRIPSFDNDLFDFYLGLPNEYRVSAQMLRYVLNKYAPRLGRIPTGNLGLPAGASPAEKTFWLIGRKLLRHTTGISRFRAPVAEDRTWPDRDRHTRSQPDRRRAIIEAANSEILADIMPCFDWSRVRRKTEEWLDKPEGGGKFLSSLLTLHGFFSRHA